MLTAKRQYSPWGAIQHTTDYAENIVFVSTASHGGFKLDRAHNAQVNPVWRRKGGWYEEDCEWCIVLTFPHAFEPKMVADAHRTAKEWLPDEYGQVYNVTVSLEESHTLRERAFDEAHKDDWVVIAASGDWHQDVPKGMVGCTATKGGKRGNGYVSPEERYFLVPSDEYEPPFVIDLTRHKEVKKVF